ncbi:APC family permease [Modestobacter sp. VKM Ac-2979]|uniref:APC family permease n=1 Tax=unclassified Modestobacter TaxID=2643866 RepID=UPI0022AB8C16|nr:MULTISPECIES: APC family permease [unclassified Modestobacter]MCZ2811719.1 APC family permease [Modestobacter sp. VKM Ac-2979]MCZ2843442.1 APC family permease [Modestobacter sp. VKM Ac-2980]
MATPTSGSTSRLAPDQLGVPGVVFLVLAAVAPLTGAIVVMALAIALGNGSGLVFAVLAVAAILLLFAVGYAQMSRELVNAGGFYAFVVKGIGRPGGLVAGFIATMGYNFFVAGAVGTTGFFTSIIVADLVGVELNWFLAGAVLMVLSFLLARGGIDISAKVLGVALVLETLTLLAFCVSVLVQTGLSVEVFTVDVMFGGSVGVALLLAATAFLGFEATSLFSEESRDPERTVPRATYTAITLIGLIHALTVWAIVSAAGVSDAQQVALDRLETGDLLFVLFEEYLGSTLLVVAQVLLIVSLFAALLAFHNMAARYLYSLGRVGILPGGLARTRTNGVPQTALVTNLVFALLVAGFFAVLGLDPITSLVPVMIGFGTLCVLVLQLLAAFSIVVHFRRRRDPRWWTTFVAPGLGMLGLLAMCVLALGNFPLLAGSDALYVRLLPWLLVLALVGGLLYAPVLRSRRPEVYQLLETDLERLDPSPVPPAEGVAARE